MLDIINESRTIPYPMPTLDPIFKPGDKVRFTGFLRGAHGLSVVEIIDLDTSAGTLVPHYLVRAPYGGVGSYPQSSLELVGVWTPDRSRAS